MKTSKELEGVIVQMLQPLKGLSFNIVIEGLSGFKVIPFDKNDAKDKAILEKLQKAAKIAGQKINKNGILRTRPNEVGNDIEPFVKEALNEVGYKANIPTTKYGKKKSTGYPDIEFIDEYGQINYIECKTFNVNNINTTQRSFYLSPSKDFKVTTNAHHFAICYEIDVFGRIGKNNIYKCISWKILNLEALQLDVKYEFNSDNAKMYNEKLILAEGEILQNSKMGIE